MAMIPIVISVISLAFSIFVFIEQRQMKTADVFESRWFRMLSELKSMSFSGSDGFDSDWASEVSLQIGFAGMKEEPSLKDVAEQISSSHSARLIRGATPEGLYGAFQSLATLREVKSEGDRDFLDQSLFAYIGSRHVAHAFYQALRHEDAKTIKFLIETGMVQRFCPPWISDHISTLKTACANQPPRKRTL